MTELASSFRDSSGALFLQDGILYRRISPSYKEHYDLLLRSGLYDKLVAAELLIPHEEVPQQIARRDSYKVIRPELIDFISYPYEWSFSQFKQAALATLKIEDLALEHGLTLKDASAYNIQFRHGKPTLIDTLSFEKYHPGQPWIAYRQFCQHFLAPLVLMGRVDIRLNQLLRIYIDGIPLDLASRLLPRRTWLSPALSVHIHAHARMQQRFGDKQVQKSPRQLSRTALRGLMDSLKSAIQNLAWRPQGTEWADYYQDTNYTPDAADQKYQLVTQFIEQVAPKQVWDLGGNIGLYSRIASNKGIPTVSFDIDPAAVEKNYLECRKKKETNILPLVLDLTNPSPALGWANQERMALALIHHLAIGNNVPLKRVAQFFHQICRTLVIEFVPKCDSQVKRLLVSREDIFTDYNQHAFEQEFSEFFTIERTEPIAASSRTLYLMRRKS